MKLRVCPPKSRWAKAVFPAACLLLLVMLNSSRLSAVGVGLLGPFAAGDFQTAREALGSGNADTGDAGWSLLNLLLAADPGQMAALEPPARASGSSGKAWQARWARENADLAFARGEYRQALDDLDPFLQDQDERRDGAIYLRAGLSWRALGRLQQAREMLASVKPEDPVFPLARFYLGDVALENGDPELALRYFDSAGAAWGEGEKSLVDGGRYQALTALGRHEQAQALLSAHLAAGQGGLPWPEAAPAAVASPDTTAGPRPSSRAGAKFCLQLGAFRDRGLAISMLNRYDGMIPDLRIEAGQDAQGQPLFRVRGGAFNDPGQAHARAEELKGQFGIEAIVKESD